MHNCFKETAETFLSSTGLKLPVDYTVDVDKRKGIYLQVNTESFLHYVLGCALLVILHVEVLFVCFDKFTAIFLWPNCLAYPNLLGTKRLVVVVVVVFLWPNCLWTTILNSVPPWITTLPQFGSQFLLHLALSNTTKKEWKIIPGSSLLFCSVNWFSSSGLTPFQ
jgi:hypothetical protein